MQMANAQPHPRQPPTPPASAKCAPPLEPQTTQPSPVANSPLHPRQRPSVRDPTFQRTLFLDSPLETAPLPSPPAAFPLHSSDVCLLPPSMTDVAPPFFVPPDACYLPMPPPAWLRPRPKPFRRIPIVDLYPTMPTAPSPYCLRLAAFGLVAATDPRWCRAYNRNTGRFTWDVLCCTGPGASLSLADLNATLASATRAFLQAEGTTASAWLRQWGGGVTSVGGPPRPLKGNIARDDVILVATRYVRRSDCES